MESNEESKRKALQSALWYFTTENSFYGALLQGLDIKYSTLLPTAAIKFDKNLGNFEVLLNPNFFCNLDLEQRQAILHHEILHFTNKHLFRLPFITATPEEMRMYNIAGDMAINQYIKNIPNGCKECPPREDVFSGKARCENEKCPGMCIDVKDWKLNNGTPFPVYKTMEEYYNLIKDNQKTNKKLLGNSKTLDEHIWGELSEEEKADMLKEAKELLKRTIEKTNFSGRLIPESIKDLLEEVEGLAASINYKSILQNCLKRTVCAQDRTSTWNRPNKRYKQYAPGTKIANMPKLYIGADSSGSISHTEMNLFLQVLDGFLKNGARECLFTLWHTNVYHKEKVKLSKGLKEDVLESGGTDVSCVLSDIVKENPDLAIVLTDGYYENSDITPTSEVIFIISKGGNMNHPMKNLGKTIPLESLK